MKHPKITGIVPILPTPFTPDDTVDLQALKSLVDFAVAAGVAAVGTPAFGSEFYKLDATERTAILETVIEHSAGRVPVIAQCNAHAPSHAARLAVQAEKMGATAVNVALPRAFASSARQLLAFARTVCDAVGVPVVVQDWYPGGEAVGLPFVVELRQHCNNFHYLKREEPGLGPLIRAIQRELGDEVGVFLGWGGLYVPELQPTGACGVMPGLGLADVFVHLWRLGTQAKYSSANALFAQMAPYIQFSLQTFEQFHHAEKRLLLSRGLLESAFVRPVTVDLNEDSSAYLDALVAHLRPLFVVNEASGVR
jgi:dihydrodipicolinate synthase/N-acetylneuraminate lyase